MQDATVAATVAGRNVHSCSRTRVTTAHGGRRAGGGRDRPREEAEEAELGRVDEDSRRAAAPRGP